MAPTRPFFGRQRSLATRWVHAGGFEPHRLALTFTLCGSDPLVPVHEATRGGGQKAVGGGARRRGRDSTTSLRHWARVLVNLHSSSFKLQPLFIYYTFYHPLPHDRW